MFVMLLIFIFGVDDYGDNDYETMAMLTMLTMLTMLIGANNRFQNKHTNIRVHPTVCSGLQLLTVHKHISVPKSVLTRRD
jgi:hypothetical protein